MPIDDEGAWQAQRIRNFEVNVEEANQQEDDAPPPVDVVIQRGLRGRLGGTAVATVGDWIEIARFIVPEPEPVVIQSAVGTMLNVVPGLPAAPIPPLNFSAPAFPRVMLRIRVGSGNQRGGSDRAEYFCVAGEMIAVSGTYITVDAQILGTRPLAISRNRSAASISLRRTSSVLSPLLSPSAVQARPKIPQSG